MRIKWLQPGHWISRPENCSSHCKCCWHRGQENLNWFMGFPLVDAGIMLKFPSFGNRSKKLQASKHQAPEKLQVPNSKFQRRMEFGTFWNFLELGTWDLELSSLFHHI